MKPDMLRFQLAEAVKTQMEEKRITRYCDLARNADVKEFALAKLVNEHSGVSIDTICKVLDYLGYDLEIVKKEF